MALESPKIDIYQNLLKRVLGDVIRCLESKFDKNIPMGSVPNCQKEILNCHAIRWFKCKLKPPKKELTCHIWVIGKFLLQSTNGTKEKIRSFMLRHAMHTKIPEHKDKRVTFPAHLIPCGYIWQQTDYSQYWYGYLSSIEPYCRITID